MDITSTKKNKSSRRLYFMAIIPDESICEVVTAIKQDFAKIYHSKAALKSPPHITLIPPFHFDDESENKLIEQLKSFCNSQISFRLELNGFGAFVPRVIFIRIGQNDNLFTLFENVNKHFEDTMGIVSKRRKGRNFSPHMTVAFSDLSKDMFFKAWKKYKHQNIYFEFEVEGISLLRHNGKFWDIGAKATFG